MRLLGLVGLVTDRPTAGAAADASAKPQGGDDTALIGVASSTPEFGLAFEDLVRGESYRELAAAMATRDIPSFVAIPT